MKRTNIGIAGAALIFTACGPISIPLDMESKSATLNIDEAVTKAEAAICEDETAEDCLILKALDASDGTSETPAALPTNIPKSFDYDHDADPDTPAVTKDMEAWLEANGVMDAINAKQAIGANLTDRIAATPESVQDVTFEAVYFNWTENTLSFDTVDLQFYVGQDQEPGEDGTYDAETLITDGGVTLAGTITAQAAGGVGESVVVFEEGGKEDLNDAIKTLKFVVAVAIPEDATFTLNETDDGLNWIKPSGQATVSLKTTLNFTVDPQAGGSSASSSAADTDAPDGETAEDDTEEESAE